MKLESIGFYTLNDERVKNQSAESPLYRCEMILTSRCNFSCPYCRPLRSDCQGDMPFEQASKTLDFWIKDGLKNVRFSGGEPMMYKGIFKLVDQAKKGGVERIALSTNGSFPTFMYKRLIDLGVNDFSISLDACCSSDGEMMSGGVKNAWESVVNNIRELSKITYVTVGVVLTEHNIGQVADIIKFADGLGVADIRVISAAQFNKPIEALASIGDDILDRHPILKYRVNNFRNGVPIRGIGENDCGTCRLVLDDMAVAGKWHYPCIIYLREQGNPIGEVGPNMRQQRAEWSAMHDCHKDPICKLNCLDVCVNFCNKAQFFKSNDNNS
jgi:sulfatase maturation enzyme AslB (radical SAM superfamily)